MSRDWGPPRGCGLPGACRRCTRRRACSPGVIHRSAVVAGHLGAAAVQPVEVFGASLHDNPFVEQGDPHQGAGRWGVTVQHHLAPPAHRATPVRVRRPKGACRGGHTATGIDPSGPKSAAV